MGDYIKREDALNFEMEIEADPEEIQAISKGMALYGEYIKSIPAADVVERKHGKILTNEFGYESCSVCHYGLMLFITDENNTLKKPNFCPNCGAEMERETN